MARLTPQVQQGMLTTFLLGGAKQVVELDDEMWQCWLRESGECSFRFLSPLGSFAVRCDKSRYWYACRMHKRQRHKHYLGTSDHVTLSALYAMAETLYEEMQGQPPSADLLAVVHAELAAYQQHAAQVTVNAPSVPEPLSAPPDTTSNISDSCFDLNKEHKPLTPREQQVLAALAIFTTNPQIASALGISVSMVKRHLVHIYEKLMISHRASLVVYAKHLYENVTIKDAMIEAEVA
jgi:DNA-binding CsgD family transcriptional regulator